MKSTAKYSFKILGLALWVILGGSVAVQAQDREKYVISAEAGGINYVSGSVTVQREGMSDSQELTSADNLHSGDRVMTGWGGRVEVLLNPGSYLRVDRNSEFELTNNSLDNLLVRLIKGSAIVEVIGADGIKMEIAVKTPQTDVVITRGGIYRFNLLPSDTTELIVRKGRAYFGAGRVNEIRGGQKVLIGRGPLQFVKVNKKEQDELDLWSEDRAEMLASANKKLRRRDLMTAFNDFGWNDYNNNGLGLWVYSARSRSFCFLPDGSRVYASPYGYSYGTGMLSCGGCPPGTSSRPPTPQNNGNPPIVVGGNGGSGSGGGGGSNDGGGNGGGGGGGNNNPTPSSVPASQPISPPAPQPSYQPPPPSAPIERSTPTRAGTEQNPNM